MRRFAVGLLLGGLVGLWLGLNIGRDASLLANPFADVRPADQAHQQAERYLGTPSR